MDLFNAYQTFKILPHGKGIIDENASVIQILKIMQQEISNYERYEREKSLNGTN